MTWETPPKVAPKKATKNVSLVPLSDETLQTEIVKTLHEKVSAIAFEACTSGNPDLARELNAVDILLSETKQALVRAIIVSPPSLASDLKSLVDMI